MIRWDAAARAYARSVHDESFATLATVLEQKHGSPLRDGFPCWPDARRWVVRSRVIVPDVAPTEIYGATYQSARSAALADLVVRPRPALVCPACGSRLTVVDPRNADKLLEQHRATERCFFRSILALFVHRGFAPCSERSRACANDERYRGALRTMLGPGSSRHTMRPWAPLPVVLALDYAIERKRTHREELPEPEHFELIDDNDPWTAHARTWSADYLNSHAWQIRDARDIAAFFAERVTAFNATTPPPQSDEP